MPSSAPRRSRGHPVTIPHARVHAGRRRGPFRLSGSAPSVRINSPPQGVLAPPRDSLRRGLDVELDVAARATPALGDEFAKLHDCVGLPT